MKIIVYDDNPDFGGHQVMTVLGVQALAADPSHDLVFLLHPGNRKLIDRVRAVSDGIILDAPCTTQRLQGIRNRLDTHGVNRLCKLLEAQHADLLLCIQGDIEQSSQALVAAHRTGIECVSYLALPHRMTTMGARLGRLRDLCNQALIPLPDRFITISGGMASLLRERGATQPIAVVPNGITAPPDPGPVRQGPPVVLGMLGRIEFNQKQQDFMVRAFSAHPQTFSKYRLRIAGSGPDRKRLERQIAACPLHANISLEEWQTDPESFYAGIDLLIIPSRYEGVPLVMLEALARRIPVIASNRDGMQELLPSDWTFNPEDMTSFIQTFSRMESSWQNDIDRIREKVLEEHTLERFRQRFVRAVTGNHDV